MLAGYPVVYLKATLVDGSYHPVDSSEIAFKLAANLAFKAALPEAKPVLMEPIGELKVTVPDNYVGDVMGDLNKRRGRVMGMNPTGDGETVLEAEVPHGRDDELRHDLRSMTQSRGTFTFNFVRYEDCPAAAAGEGHCRGQGSGRCRVKLLSKIRRRTLLRRIFSAAKKFMESFSKCCICNLMNPLDSVLILRPSQGGTPPESKKPSTNDKNMEVMIMKKWVCPVCGYVHEGENPPAECPVCHVSGDKFTLQAEEKTWAAEHVVGVGKVFGEDVPAEVREEIIAGLRANFEGECSEVGMYLAMARVAHREGYPEIGMYWEKAGLEEAEHAAKFAELLGEVVTDSTQKNLQMRVDAENGATAGKFELAKLAKKYNLDAIHDTVHEMARDEARHGKAFEGLLKRYFNK